MLIIAGFVHIGWEKSGRGLTFFGLEKVPSEPFLDELLGFSFVILQGLGVLCLLALFPFVTALIVLPVGPLLRGCLLLMVLET